MIDLEKIYNEEKTKRRARWMTLVEARTLVAVAKPYSVVVESGTANGWSACCLAAAGHKVITFDPVNRSKLWDEIEELKPLASNIEYVQEEFHTGVKRFLPRLAFSPCCFFIDGDHTAGGVQRDFDAVKNCEGIFVFHDTTSIEALVRFIHRIDENEYEKRTIHTERGMTVVRHKIVE